MKHFILLIVGIVLSFNAIAGISGGPTLLQLYLIKERSVLKDESARYLANIATRIYLKNESSLRLNTKQKKSVNCMAENLWQEARGGDLKQKLLIASVVVNRTKNSKYPSDICSVIFQPYQFSWTLNKSNTKHFHEIRKINPLKNGYRDSLYVTFYTVLFHGNVKDNIIAYYAPRYVKHSPLWSKNGRFNFVMEYQGNKFYSEAKD